MAGILKSSSATVSSHGISDSPPAAQTTSATSQFDGQQDGEPPIDVNQLMLRAFGEPLVQPEHPSVDDDDVDIWYKRWWTVVHLKGLLYTIPGGAIGRKFTDTLSEEVLHLAAGNYPSDRLIVFSSVILQRDKMVKKGCDIRRVIEKRLMLWSEDKFDQLIDNAVRCDKSFHHPPARRDDKDHIVSVFTRLMLQGRVKAAVRWLCEKSSSHVLKPSDMVEVKTNEGNLTNVSVLEVLRNKHPDPQVPSSKFFLQQDTLPAFSDLDVTGAHIHFIASRIQGGAGPGGCDANMWHDVLLRYGAHSERLRDSVASLVRRLANNIVPWSDIRGFLSCRLIALDKSPGVRPIGVGETLRRIVGKTVCYLTRDDIEEVCGISQLCCGIKAGIEGAIHATSDMFNEYGCNGWGVLSVDATNAFNNISRYAILWNSRILWPHCSRFIFNTYRGWVPLIMKESNELLYSKEGVTQGDPLSMFLYAVGTLPLIRLLDRPDQGSQIWCADDASACAPLCHLKDWFIRLMEIGPSTGYYPEPSKCCIVVTSDYFSEATQLFDSIGVHVKTSHRLLGGVIGDTDGIESFVTNKVGEWCNLVDSLCMVAETQPQAAYSAFVKSIQNKWLFLQRVVPHCELRFEDLEKIISEKLIPTIFSSEISTTERELFSLPARMGGLNILNPVQTNEMSYSISRKLTDTITKALQRNIPFDSGQHLSNYLHIQEEVIRLKNSMLNDKFAVIFQNLNQPQQRAILRTKDQKISTWLTVLPISRYQFDLSPQEFRDALSIRYKKPLLCIPPLCDGCGSSFDLSHALSCKKGGLVTLRHNEIRDTFGDLSSFAWSQIKKEPVVRESNLNDKTPALIADLSVRGVWQPQVEALFDIRVIDTDAQSYSNRSPKDILSMAEKEKKAKYNKACLDRRALFTPLCVSVDGLLGHETSVFVKRLAEQLSFKWDMSYNRVMCWLRTHLTFSILRASIICLRGSRTKWRTINMANGSPLSLIMS
jgi:hypothetical protein